MNAPDALAAATDLVLREALYLDERRWDDWLALYREDAVFWVPAWKDEDTATEDPENEVSLIYISARAQLEERVARVRSGRSAASAPLPRTAHGVSNIVLVPGDAADTLTVRSQATTHIFDVKRRESFTYFGPCEHRLVLTDGEWRIKRKKIVVLNDYLTTIVDFYSV